MHAQRRALALLLPLGLSVWHPQPLTGLRAQAAGTCDPPPASSEVRFAVIGDYGITGQPEADVAALVKGWLPDFVVTVGDNNYPAGESSSIDTNIGQYYSDYICPYGSPLGGYGGGNTINRFFPTLGNHDWYASTSPSNQPYLDYFALPGNERYYDFTWGPVHFFMLDSDTNEPDGRMASSSQAGWLQSGLASSISPWNIVLLHHAPFSSGAIHGSDPDLQWPFQLWGADAVLAGHEHTYERIVLGGMPYFVNGLGGSTRYQLSDPVAGSQLFYSADYGAMLVQASELDIVFKFITRSGQLIDTHSLSKHRVPRADFNGDQTSDISIYRNGKWYIKDQQSQAYGGVLGDVPVPGDYDGDGSMDVAIYRPQGGVWYIKGLWTAGYGGVPGDIPVPGDYNGDGITDAAIYRNGMWYVKDVFSMPYGAPGDVPLPADYDGDGRTDLAVYRNGMWYVKDQFAVGYGGVPGDIPVPADYDGNGTTDLAIYRSGMWYVRGKFSVSYGGMPEDIPVPADYDGDGAADLAIYRTGVWYVKGPAPTVPYGGMPGDFPLPAPDTNGDGDPHQ